MDTYERLLKKIEGNQHQLSQLSAGYEDLTRKAYLQARDDINARIRKLIESRGGLENLSGRDRWRITRDTGLIQNIEGRLTELGSEHTSIVNKAFSESGSLARMHLADELKALVDQANLVSGVATPVAAVVDFAKLDTAAIELGLGTALNDVSALTEATKITMKREVTAGIAAGEGIGKLSRRVNVLEGISTNRAEVITRWASIKSYNLVHQATYEAALSSIPMLKKMWLTQTDERACPHCLAQHGQVVEVAGEFDPELTYANTPPTPYQGFTETPPLHPRCRCTITSWSEDWRGYTTATPEELSEAGRQLALKEGHPKAATAGVQGVRPEVGIRTAASNALGDMMSGIYVFDDYHGTVRIAEGVDMADARLALRDAGFRVQNVAGDSRLLRIDFPRGRALPRMIRSTKLAGVSEARWQAIRKGLLRCALD